MPAFLQKTFNFTGFSDIVLLYNLHSPAFMTEFSH